MTSSALADLDRDFLAARNGDRAAFGRLVAATQRMVASIALAVSADVHESEDIAQDVFVLAWQRLRDMRGPASLLPWLRHVTRHRAIDRIRAARYRERTQVEWGDRAADVADDAAGVTERLSAEQDAALLARAIDEITADSREVLLLYYREGESGRRVATLLGISEAAVRKRLQRARESLRSETHRLLGDAAQRTAPGPAFTLLVGAALLQPTAPSAAAGSAGGGMGALAAAWKWLAGPFGGLVLSIGLVVAAVWWEMRGHVSRLVDARDRRAMRDNGVVYAALMATYMVLLWHASRAHWSRTALLLTAAGFSAAIIALAWRRARLLANRAVRNQAGGPRNDT